MPQYQYEVKRGPNDVASGILEADNERAALARLRDMGYFPLSIEEYHGESKRDSLRYAFTRVRLKDRNLFFRQLANLFESGMPLTRAFSTLMEQTENPKMVRIIEQLRDEIQRGSTFAEAMERHPQVFPPMLTSLIRAGESGGMLDEVIWRIVTFGEQEEELRGKTFSAMVYPAFLLVMGTIAVFILVSFVFPRFITIFEDFDVPLPLPTRIVMGICDFMGLYWWGVLLGLGVFAAAVWSFWRSDEGRKQMDRLMLRVPVLGAVIQRYEMAKFARTLGTLLDNGVPVLTSLRITVETLSNSAVAREVARVQERVAEGDSISESLHQCSHFTPMVVSMFAVGEESGRLGAVTRRIADAYDVEVDRAVKAMASLLEPILIVIMGVVIGFLVIAMLLPMLTLTAHVG